MSKAYQYATNDVKLCIGMKDVFEECPTSFTKDYNLDLKVWKRLVIVG